jgi:hypothetical protein
VPAKWLALQVASTSNESNKRKCCLEASSALNEIYDQDDDSNYEQDVDQAAANVTDKAKKPQYH